MKNLLHSEIFRKIFFALLFFAVVPALVLGWVALVAGNQAGITANSLSRAALDEKSIDMLELQATSAAETIADFLSEREADLEVLAWLPKTEEAFLNFHDEHIRVIWGMQDGFEYRMKEPLYVEIAWVDVNGKELLKVADGKIVPSSDLRSADDPDTSRYPATNWFEETIHLPKDEVYVGHLSGYFLTAEEFKSGQHYDGIIRFAKPVYDENDTVIGAVTLALDYRHLAQFSSHIVPNEKRFAAEPDVSNGNYAYIIDDRGWTLVHPNEFYQYGTDPDGNPLPYVTSVEDIGSLPIRLDQIGFLDQNLASIPGLVNSGKEGSIFYTWQGQDKFVAFAAIPYYGGSYEYPDGFGWIGIGAEVGAFHQAADHVGSAISERVQSLKWGILVILFGGGLVSIPVAGILARSVASPVQRLIQAAQMVEKGEPDLDVLDPLLESKSQGEMATLARVFRQMADQVYQREKKLRETISKLRIEIDETRKQQELNQVVQSEYFQSLQERVKELKKKKADENEE